MIFLRSFIFYIGYLGSGLLASFLAILVIALYLVLLRFIKYPYDRIVLASNDRTVPATINNTIMFGALLKIH